jgi:hypothetical protein
MIEIATAINNFASQATQIDFVPPSEESVFVLTSGQLQGIIKEAIQPLQDRIESLEARIIAQDEKIASLESTQEQDTTRICVDIAHDRQRIAKLESPKLEVDSPLLNELYKEMKAQGRKQTDFATAARMVKRSKRRITQLKTAIALDQRFILLPSDSHSQKMIIRLREYYKTA